MRNNIYSFVNRLQCSSNLFLSSICKSTVPLHSNSNKCRTYREIKAVYKCENYLDCNIRHDLRMFYTKFRLSSHKFLIERARWHKMPYHERTCTLCNKHDIQDEYHVALICEYFKNIREKYIKPYYYNRPSLIKFIELMNTPNSKERFRMMLFLKIVFKLYAETLKQ